MLSREMTVDNARKNAIDFLALSAEAQESPLPEEEYSPSLKNDMKKVTLAVNQARNKAEARGSVVARNHTLIQAHLQRLHNLLTTELKEEQRRILSASLPIADAMVDCALCVKEGDGSAAMQMIEFRRCLRHEWPGCGTVASCAFLVRFLCFLRF